MDGRKSLVLELLRDGINRTCALVQPGGDLDFRALADQPRVATPVVLGGQVRVEVVARQEGSTAHATPVDMRPAAHVELVLVAREVVVVLRCKCVPHAAVNALEHWAVAWRVAAVAPRIRRWRLRRRAAASLGVRRASTSAATTTTDTTRRGKGSPALLVVTRTFLRTFLLLVATFDVSQHSTARVDWSVVADHTSRRQERVRPIGARR